MTKKILEKIHDENLTLLFGEGSSLRLRFEIVRSLLLLTSCDFYHVLISSGTNILLVLSLLDSKPLGGGSKISTIALGQLLLDLIPEGVLQVILTWTWSQDIRSFVATESGFR